MANKNPLSTAQRASYDAGHVEAFNSPNRPILQANPAMRSRLQWLARISDYPMEARHG